MVILVIIHSIGHPKYNNYFAEVKEIAILVLKHISEIVITPTLDSIYFEGYANQLKESDPEKLQFEYAEYKAAMA